MTTNSSSKRDSQNQGSDTGSNNPTASEAHRATPTPTPAPVTGRLSNGYVGSTASREGTATGNSLYKD